MDNHITLTELNTLIKEALQLSFPEQVWVVAEIGELKVNRTGHCYIELVEKDNTTDEITARTRATIWSWQFRFIQPYFESTTGQTLGAGIKVLLSVTVEYHEVYGISLNIKDIDPNYTLGDMARKRQEIIKQLHDDGVFDMNKELELAEIPNRLAIISSPTAAGYEDFINQLHQNENGYSFYARLFAATMQGNDAPLSIMNALEEIYSMEHLFDAVVIIRGGGSQMDLACFDNYELAYHITQFPIPVITGIGHEKDDSIVDMVAHTRLKTPTAVAAFFIETLDVVNNEIIDLKRYAVSLLEKYLSEKGTQLGHCIKIFKPLAKGKIEQHNIELKHLGKNVKPVVEKLLTNHQFKLNLQTDHLKVSSQVAIRNMINQISLLNSKSGYIGKIRTKQELDHLDELQRHLKFITAKAIENQRKNLIHLERNKDLIDPKTILKRGYSITYTNGKVVKSATQLSKGDRVETHLPDGIFNSEILEIKHNK